MQNDVISGQEEENPNSVAQLAKRVGTTHTRTHTHTHTHTQTHTHTHTRVYDCAYTRLHTCMRAYTDTHVKVHTHSNTYARTHTYTQIHGNTHTHTHKSHKGSHTLSISGCFAMQISVHEGRLGDTGSYFWFISRWEHDDSTQNIC